MAGTMPAWAGLAIFGGIVAGIGGLVAFAIQSGKKRTAAFSDYAVKSRGDFSAKSDPSLAGACKAV